MSQHTYTCAPYSVLTGWDRPLGQFFLVISLAGDVEYSNLDDPQATPTGGLSLEQIQARLREWHLRVPDGLLQALEEDRRADRGSHARQWTLPPT